MKRASDEFHLFLSVFKRCKPINRWRFDPLRCKRIQLKWMGIRLNRHTLSERIQKKKQIQYIVQILLDGRFLVNYSHASRLFGKVYLKIGEHLRFSSAIGSIIDKILPYFSNYRIDYFKPNDLSTELMELNGTIENLSKLPLS